jgi:tRNA(adenine34) deaminase
MHPSTLDAIDRMMMARCIDLSRQALEEGEYPFACVIARDGQVVVESTNRVARDRDVTRHAELLAVSEAQRKLGRSKLARCTLYTTVEPCPMCSFPIRESGIGRVVYAIRSPLMGGHSRWNVLGDSVIAAEMPEIFGPAPKIVAGFLRKEAERVWWRWNPIVWGIIRLRRVFGGGVPDASPSAVPLLSPGGLIDRQEEPKAAAPVVPAGLGRSR